MAEPDHFPSEGTPTPGSRPMRAGAGVRTVGVVGGGAIGSSWATLGLNLGLDVVLVDASEHARDRLGSLLESRTAESADVGRLRVSGELADLGDADLILEAVPERLELKHEVFRVLDECTSPDVVLASSTSALTATSIQAACTRHPERVIVAHPFNPPHLMPLVEVVAGELTSEKAVAATQATMLAWGKRPVRLRRELPGHLANRLQAALWKEAYFLVASGAASASEIDEVIAAGPGLRWALLGPFATQHLSGGEGGFGHLMEHLAAPTAAMWAQLGDVELTPTVIAALVTSVEEAMAGLDTADLSRRRDTALRRLLEIKKNQQLDSAP